MKYSYALHNAAHLVGAVYSRAQSSNYAALKPSYAFGYPRLVSSLYSVKELQ
jgi:hypothetical protein